MNKTVPNDGKQHRQSQEYVPSGPIIAKTIWLNCSVADARRELCKFGSIAVMYDRSTYNAKAFCREAIGKKTRQRNKIKPCRNHILNVPQIKITFSTDQAGHDLANDAICNVNSYYDSVRMFRRKQEELEKLEELTTNRPPVVKRLTGKERKIAKKRAENTKVELDKE